MLSRALLKSSDSTYDEQLCFENWAIRIFPKDTKLAFAQAQLYTCTMFKFFNDVHILCNQRKKCKLQSCWMYEITLKKKRRNVLKCMFAIINVQSND